MNRLRIPISASEPKPQLQSMPNVFRSTSSSQSSIIIIKVLRNRRRIAQHNQTAPPLQPANRLHHLPTTTATERTLGKSPPSFLPTEIQCHRSRNRTATVSDARNSAPARSQLNLMTATEAADLPFRTGPSRIAHAHSRYRGRA